MQIFQFNLWEQDISLLLQGTLWKYVRKQRKLLHEMGNKEFKGIKGSEGLVSHPKLPWWMILVIQLFLSLELVVGIKY